MTYKYEDMKDKSSEGIDKELSHGLSVIAFYMMTTEGIPKEIVAEKLEGLSKIEQLALYMGFRSKHPNLTEWN